MGIVIINDWQSNPDPDRQLSTPNGDLEELHRRIREYLQKAKSEALDRSLQAPPPPPGQPWPPADHTGAIRARVPGEMFPPVLVASNNLQFKDFEGGTGLGYIVSQAFRDAVETLDEDVHQFVPVEMRREDGVLHDKRPFYFLRVTRLLNTINVEASPLLRRVDSKPQTEPVTDTTMFHLGDTAFTVHADRAAEIGLWRDIRSTNHILASQRLIDLLKARGITGWAANSTFTEL